jgi:hypothetical protein
MAHVRYPHIPPNHIATSLPAGSSEGCYKLDGSCTLSSYPTTIIVLRMAQTLKDAAEQGNIDALYLLIADDLKVLDKMDGFHLLRRLYT